LYNSSNILQGTNYTGYGKRFGFSVRCVKD
jgi:hypothetical protein